MIYYDCSGHVSSHKPSLHRKNSAPSPRLRGPHATSTQPRVPSKNKTRTWTRNPNDDVITRTKHEPKDTIHAPRHPWSNHQMCQP